MDDVKVFAPLKRPKKVIDATADFSEEEFIKMKNKGHSDRDAALLAGYKGTSPESFAKKLLTSNTPRSQRVKAQLADIFERKAKMALRKMNSEGMDRMSPLQLAQTADIMTKNARLERGQSTSNSVVAHIDFANASDDDLQRYLAEKSRESATGGK